MPMERGPGGEATSKNHPNVDQYVASRVRALESLLLEKGILPPDLVDRVVRQYAEDTGPLLGARAVARAWANPEYKHLLLDQPKAALTEFGLDYGDLRVVENTPAVHNMVVCTLCSCYPWEVLGLPPVWYKSAPYRSRAEHKEDCAPALSHQTLTLRRGELKPDR